MAKKSAMSGSNVLFNVEYVDGSLRSNRRVPGHLLDGLDGDKPAETEIIRQDLEISKKSGVAPLEIKSLMRVGAKKPKVRS